MKSNKGITLVALVITIIVLLILAGVSISLVVGDNGVLTQAQSASKKTDLASAENAIQLSLSSLSTKFMGETWVNNVNAKFSTTVTCQALADELNNNGYKLIVVSDTVQTKIGENTPVTTAYTAGNAIGAGNRYFTFCEKGASAEDTVYCIGYTIGDRGASALTGAEIKTLPKN